MPHDEDELPRLLELLNSPEALTRLKAARQLAESCDPQAWLSLRERALVEVNPVVKQAMQRASHYFPDEFEPELNLAKAHQRVKILRAQLGQAYRNFDVERVEHVRAQLVEAQIAVRKCLTEGSLTAGTIGELRNRYAEAASRERILGLLGPIRWCWVCWADVDTYNNSTCRCGWWICECGACQCPDFWLGIRSPRQAECQEQSHRLGEAQYAELVEARRTRALNYSFARVDFGTS